MTYSENQLPAGHLLPYDGTVIYSGKVLAPQRADTFLHALTHTIAWRNDEAIIMGKHLFTKRKVAWYGDAAFSYTYSNIERTALPWTALLLELKQLCQNITGASYNSCLLNLYHDGSEGMAWHSDGEKTLGINSSIASLSFGAERKFCFKHKTDKVIVPVVLQHGSLLEMKDETQKHWLHRLPPTKKINTARINLTFRSILQN